MMLSPELEKAFKKDSIAYEDEKNMPYISNLERESREAGKVELVIKQLNRRNQLSEETLEKIKALPIGQLEQLGEDLMDFTSSKDLADWLQRFASS
jgi:Domain of unknown function (DUF4351)